MFPTRKLGRARRLAGVLVLALLVQQWTALAHAVRHAPGLEAHQVAGVDDADDLDHDAGSPECRLVDQLLSGQALAGSASHLPADDAGQALNERCPAGRDAAGAARVYEARAPPRA